MLIRSDRDPPRLADPVPLAHLHAGCHAVFHGTSLSPDDCAMLGAMGLTEQCRLCVRHTTGTCCIIQVDSTRLALAPPVAARIMVSPMRGALAPSG